MAARHVRYHAGSPGTVLAKPGVLAFQRVDGATRSTAHCQWQRAYLRVSAVRGGAARRGLPSSAPGFCRLQCEGLGPVTVPPGTSSMGNPHLFSCDQNL
jgi:hypothetical protein